MLNKCVFLGRFVRDPDLRRTPNGTAVTSFTLAVDRDYTSKEEGKKTDFIDFVSFRGTAEFVSKYFGKGRMAVVEGRLQIRDWTDSEGKKRRNAEILAENVYFANARTDNGDSKKSTYGAPVDVSPSEEEFVELGEDEDLPF